ncbi:acyloxyacyl hydrolase [Mongoliitalea daihaiensis]|uniref:acyloxyacyl hydrolase n=1 Tax=Mongoliitalea daihaiensis TaxID=2782006 RepID=UPI001F485AE5|nr:acyloxyacyl hydrolase [Mongoliitalea daihaiensis]UJP64299.1 acyloxyacyl hydrolase [Mongoliitalea daihaiensis]
MLLIVGFLFGVLEFDIRVLDTAEWSNSSASKSYMNTFLKIDSLDKALPKYRKDFSVLVERGPLVHANTDWGRELRNSFEYKAVDVRLGFKRTEPTLYNHLYRNPTFGVGFYSATFKSEFLGQPHALYAFVDIPFKKRYFNEQLSFSYFTSVGIGFNFRPFDEEENPLNQFIGSYENIYSHFGFTSSYRINAGLFLDASIGLKHFSNGSLRKPNTGLNFIPFTIGLRSVLNERYHIATYKKPIPIFEDVPQWNFLVSAGGKNYTTGEGQYPKLAVGIQRVWQRDYKFRFGVGADMFYSGAAASRLNRSPVSFSDRASVGVIGIWEWVLTPQLYVPIGIGAYLHRNTHNEEVTWYYSRVGIRYRLTNGISAGLSIKAHALKADFFEWTVAYSIFNDRNRY